MQVLRAWPRIAAGVVLCAVLAGCAGSQGAGGRGGAALEGEYFFGGRLRDTEETTSTVTLWPPVQSKYALTWKKDDRTLADGVAIRHGAVVALVQGRRPQDFSNDYVDLGVAVYEMDGAQLRGVRGFLDKPREAPQAETLVPIAGKPDRYTLVAADGTTVPGVEVKITPNGDGYLFALFDPKPSMVGTGIKLGNSYVFGLSTTNLPSVMALCRVGDELRGVGVLNAGKGARRYAMMPLTGKLPDDLPEAGCAKALNAF
jgi:hypothetical protein